PLTALSPLSHTTLFRSLLGSGGDGLDSSLRVRREQPQQFDAGIAGAPYNADPDHFVPRSINMADKLPMIRVSRQFTNRPAAAIGPDSGVRCVSVDQSLPYHGCGDLVRRSVLSAAAVRLSRHERGSDQP